MVRRLSPLALSAALALSSAVAQEIHAAPAVPTGLSTILASGIPDSEPVRAVAMFDRVPTASDVSALRALGLIAQPLRYLPMALTKGTVPQLQRAVDTGVASDIYLDMPLQYHSKESTAAMSADITRALGFDGRGVGIAIVDSGIDASHPDLINRVVRNVRVYSAEYLDVLGLSEPTGFTPPYKPYLVLTFDDLPYNNTDTIGHGTHVAGIAAADGSATPDLVGVAPGASLVGYSTGEVLFIFTILSSFDDILGTHKDHNVRVINNSWGSRYQLFDPNAPINVATKALHDAGITIAFSAGNDGLEMTTNPNSMAPWVINVGSATVQKQKSDFSSAGLMFDNTSAAGLDADHHAHFDGDGLGLSHPDVSAPGSSITSTCTPTGWICAPVLPGGSGVSSGTSMSSPHVAGLAAVLLQARPELTPDQVRQVMQLASVAMRGAGRKPAPFWQSGYGFVDAKLAVDLVLRSDFSQALLDGLQAEKDASVLAARPFKVVASDHWNFVSQGATVMGLETRDFPIQVGADTGAIRAGVSFPSDLGIVAGNFVYEWSLTLLDPDGKAVATSEPVAGVGVQILQVDFKDKSPKPGTWTVRAEGVIHISQPGLLWGHTVTVSVTQLQPQNAASTKEQDVSEGSGLFVGSLSLTPLLGALLPFGLLVVWRRAQVGRSREFSRRVS